MIVFNNSINDIISVVCLNSMNLLIHIGIIYLQMGNSKAKPGIFIQTQKSFYLPGQIVQGSVFINAQQPYPTTKKTWWRPTGNDNTTTSSNVASNHNLVGGHGIRPNHGRIQVAGDRFGQCKIVQASFILNSWGNTASLHGQYAFPFEFQLPTFIPGSFREQSPTYRASIVYELTCLCISPKKGEDIVVSQQLIVRQPKKNNQESLYGEVYLYPQTCCCSKNGVTRVCCYFQKNQYTPGQQCIAICEADNYKCSLRIRQIKVRFKKVVTLVSGFGEQKVIAQQINQSSFPGVEPFGQYTQQNAKKISVPLKYRDSKSPIHPTTNGRLVKCHYYLEVTPEFSGWFLRNTQSFQVNLNILQQGLPIPQLEKPDNWNPQIYRKSQIMLNQNFQNNLVNNMNQNYF